MLQEGDRGGVALEARREHESEAAVGVARVGVLRRARRHAERVLEPPRGLRAFERERRGAGGLGQRAEGVAALSEGFAPWRGESARLAYVPVAARSIASPPVSSDTEPAKAAKRASSASTKERTRSTLRSNRSSRDSPARCVSNPPFPGDRRL